MALVMSFFFVQGMKCVPPGSMSILTFEALVSFCFANSTLPGGTHVSLSPCTRYTLHFTLTKSGTRAITSFLKKTSSVLLGLKDPGRRYLKGTFSMKNRHCSLGSRSGSTEPDISIMPSKRSGASAAILTTSGPPSE